MMLYSCVFKKNGGLGEFGLQCWFVLIV